MTFQKTAYVGEQADALRGLMDRLRSNRTAAESDSRPARARAVAITSGKGGVGKTNLALNLAIALAQTDAATCLIDANLGLGNIDLLCGLNGYWNLSHVVSGARNLREIVLEGPAGVDVIPGASGLTELADWPADVQADVFHQLEEFESTHDFLIIDTGTGIHRAVREFLVACDLVLVVTTPEPTSIADAYATIKSLSANKSLALELLVNQCDSPGQAQLIAERVQETARNFLHVSVSPAGFIPTDPCVPAAVTQRKPFLLENPQSPASSAIQQLAFRLRRRFETQPRHTAFFPRIQNPHLCKSA